MCWPLCHILFNHVDKNHFFQQIQEKMWQPKPATNLCVPADCRSLKPDKKQIHLNYIASTI